MLQCDQDMLLTIAHLVNNPLTSIRNAIYLASRLTDNQELLDYLDLANGEITRISSSLTQISIEAGGPRKFKAAA
jgi:signal transduction histidine kinase